MKNITKRILNSISNISMQEKVCTCVLFVQIVSLYYILSNMGFGTHDEMAQYITYSNPNWEFNLDLSKRFVPVIGQLFMYFQFNAPSFAIYRIYTLLAILLGVGSASFFVKHHISEKDWLKYAIVFLAFLQVTGMHNGAVAFDMTYQYRMFYCFTFLDLYLLFCKTEKKRYLILGTFFWAVAINSYEAFYPFCIILFLMAVITLYDKKQLTIKNLFRFLWLPAIVAVLSVTVYVIKMGMSGQMYAGAMVSTTYGILHKVKSILIYTFGNFPLRLNQFSFREIVRKLSTSDLGNLTIILKNLLVAAVVCKGVEIKRLTTKRQWAIYTVLAAISAILIALLVGVTQQYCTWAFVYGEIMGGISYYSYFFIIMVVFLLMGGLNKIKCKQAAVIVKSAVLICVFFVGITTDINNKETATQLDKTDNKYELFDQVVNSEYFSSIEDNILIYAPEMVGVHNNLDYLAIYCKQMVGKSVEFCNQMSDINFERQVYMLRYLPECDIMMLGKITSDDLIVEEIYTVAMKSLSDYSIYAWRNLGNKATPVYINGMSMGRYGDVISIPLNGVKLGTDMILQIENLPIKDVGFLGGSILDSAVLRLTYGGGIHEQEHFGRWVAAKSHYILDYKGTEEQMGTICLELATAASERGIVRVEVNDEIQVYEVKEESELIEIQTWIKKGKNRITIISEVPSLQTTDIRDINLKLTDAYGVFEGEKYKFY